MQRSHPNSLAKWLLTVICLAQASMFSNAQNVGIGTETPAEKLEVNGNIRLSRGAHRSIGITNAPGGVSGNNLTISAGSTEYDNSAANGGNLELKAGNSNAYGAQAGGNVMISVGLNEWGGGGGGIHGDIIFRGGTSNDWYTIVEYGRMIGNTGNWGFGTATPTTRVDVAGTVKAIGFQLTTGASDGFVLTSNASGVASWVNANSLTVTETDPEVGANTSNYLSKWNGTQLVTSGLFENSGNVGIGINAPAAKLHIRPANDIQNAPASDLILARIWNSNVDTRASGIFHYYSTTTTNDNLAFGVSGGGGTNAAPNALAQIKMVIQGNGNVGIGTITPANKLDVAGTGGLRVNSTNPGTGNIDWIAGNFGGTAGNRVVMGIQSAVATIGAHNNALNAWANLSINPGGGNVGIGNLAPVNKLDVEGGLAVGNSYSGTSIAPANGAIIQGNVGIGTPAPVNKLDVEGGVAIGPGFSGTNTAPSDGAIIEGSLGVGLPNPGAQLDVYGDFRLGKGGSILASIIKVNVVLAPQIFPANANTGISYAVTGAAVGASVIVSPSVPLPNGMVIAFAFVSSNGNVDVVFRNTTGGPINYVGGIVLYITVVN